MSAKLDQRFRDTRRKCERDLQRFSARGWFFVPPRFESLVEDSNAPRERGYVRIVYEYSGVAGLGAVGRPRLVTGYYSPRWVITMLWATVQLLRARAMIERASDDPVWREAALAAYRLAGIPGLIALDAWPCRA